MTQQMAHFPAFTTSPSLPQSPTYSPFRHNHLSFSSFFTRVINSRTNLSFNLFWLKSRYPSPNAVTNLIARLEAPRKVEQLAQEFKIVLCSKRESNPPHYNYRSSVYSEKTHLRHNRCSPMACSCSWTSLEDRGKKHKRVWIWTKNKEVMTAAVERGWNTFIFPSHLQHLAHHWSSIAVICPLFVGEGEILDGQNKRVATIFDVSTPEELERLRPEDEQAENILVNLLDWQVIPAENIIAAFQSSQKTVFAISNNASEAQIFLEALEHGLDGIVLKVEDVEPVLELKEYFDRRMEESNLLSLTKATVTHVQVAGMGDRVCVDICSLMRPGEGLLVGSFARGLFLVHSECLESNYIASRPFRVNAGPVHAYVAVPGGRTCYLSELKSGKEVIVVDQLGHQQIAIVGRVKIETRPLILVEAKRDSDNQTISILLQNAETCYLLAYFRKYTFKNSCSCYITESWR